MLIRVCPPAGLPCPSLSAPANGSVDATSGVTDDVRTYSCLPGFAPAQTATLCRPDATWSMAQPVCAGE